MSPAERFDTASQIFDATRQPLGAEIVAGRLAGCGKPLNETRLLDAGCGTGLYSEALVSEVGEIDALDLSTGMLAVAHRKLSEEALQGRVRFHHGDIEALPFSDGVFDGVMTNQVLSHLESGGDQSYPVHHRVLIEDFRVLRPGGVVLLNVTTRQQLLEGFWHYDLIGDCVEAYLARCIPSRTLIDHLQEIGFVFEGRTVPLDGVLHGRQYFNAEGPLDPAWRRADPVWATATAEQVGGAEDAVREMHREGTLQAYVEEREARRHRVGQLTFFVARKP